LVVIAIIGILIALLLPAVQAAREAARRSQCSNNLKQIGLGLHNYHDVFNSFPFGYFIDLIPGTSVNIQCWGPRILPYIEQAPLYQQYDNRVPPFNEAVGFGHTAASIAQNMAVISTPVTTFLCPSTPGSPSERVFNCGLGPASGAPFTLTWRGAASDYIASSGVRGAFANLAYNNNAGGNRGGVLLELARAPSIGQNAINTTRMADVTDGTSNTMIIGERVGGPDIYFKGMPVPRNLPGIGTALHDANGGTWGDFCNGDHWVSGSLYDWGNNPMNLLSEGPCGINCSSVRGRGFYAFHPGGAQFLLTDGSVRFVSQTVDAFVLASMITRGKGETFTMP